MSPSIIFAGVTKDKFPDVFIMYADGIYMVKVVGIGRVVLTDPGTRPTGEDGPEVKAGQQNTSSTSAAA